MEEILIIVIAAGVAIFIAIPFFKIGSRKSSLGDESDPARIAAGYRLRKLNTEKESLYTAIKDIEFDYDMGKLSEEDYEQLKREYKVRAAAVLKEIDEIEKGEGVSSSREYEIEKEIASARRSIPSYEDEIEKEIMEARSKSNQPNLKLVCIECEIEYETGDKFCSKCGSKLYERNTSKTA